ncbi:hypothetical protein P153DRAFT_365580 [Dothidotthia symphoricarpi CBS 119687]|uniref:Large ribosomal subunit protein bL28m n=1 Tax=Dothidotthia symphoricarpi CBS 119687 TaxID=1392245 RepID=A0A6A6AIM7_9PLEO|nr:uncharacterized protein P153DRAFT_365580 [Dothidotthia symphoricarpi CBS 119687]KAF2130955.1 hypothetical protein P153DRAFT_365580 [Dothidotthia symphoricarpi CBS 119687]
MHPRCQLLSGRLASSGAVLRNPQSTQRTFSTSSPLHKNPLQRKHGGDLGSHLPKHVIPQDALIPEYPYGDYQLFKQSNKGLYGEQMIQYGNNVSHKTETKTRRKWKPNVLSKSLFSVALKKRVKLRITSNVLKTIDREGGLDEYLLKSTESRIKELGPTGWALRWTLMQKPDVIARLRAEAAELGIDQAIIDKQWPTHQMMAREKSAQYVLTRDSEQAILARESEQATLTGESRFVVDEEDYMGEAEEEEPWDAVEPATSQSPAPTQSKALRQQERKVTTEAVSEYIKAVKAAERYLKRGLVDSEEEGLKLAFVRAKEREEASTQLKQKFDEKVGQQFSSKDLQKVRTQFKLPIINDHEARKIAYNQWRRQQIEQTGSYEAWKQSQNAEKTAARDEMLREAGGPEAWQENRRAMYAKLIKDAERAPSNQTLDAETRQYLRNAIKKADRAIRARTSGGQQVYAELTLEETRHGRQSRSASSGGLDELMKASKREKNTGGDAWAALVSSSNKSTESRLRT